MKVKNKIFIFALILSLILSVGAVVAADNMTFDQSEISAVSHETEVKISQEETLAENDDDSDSKLADGGNQLLGAGERHVSGNAFSDITSAINAAGEGDTIFLDGKNYTGTYVMTIKKTA